MNEGARDPRCLLSGNWSNVYFGTGYLKTPNPVNQYLNLYPEIVNFTIYNGDGKTDLCDWVDECRTFAEAAGYSTIDVGDFDLDGKVECKAWWGSANSDGTPFDAGKNADDGHEAYGFTRDIPSLEPLSACAYVNDFLVFGRGRAKALFPKPEISDRATYGFTLASSLTDCEAVEACSANAIKYKYHSFDLRLYDTQWLCTIFHLYTTDSTAIIDTGEKVPKFMHTLPIPSSQTART